MTSPMSTGGQVARAPLVTLVQARRDEMHRTAARMNNSFKVSHTVKCPVWNSTRGLCNLQWNV